MNAAREDGATLLIDGRWRVASETFVRFDPASLQSPTGVYAAASSDDVREAYDAAAAALAGWAGTPAPARGEILRLAGERLGERADEAARQLTADMGKPIRDARAEVARSIAICRYFAGEALQPVGETYGSADPQTTLLTFEQPLGVICAITPWNFPFAIPAWKLAPALVFGNTVVWKPAEVASGSAVVLAEALVAAGLPPGVLNLVTGYGPALSPALTGERRLSGVTFTGSVRVGTLVRQAVADRNVKVQLELGGKNPAIVLADADLEDAATQVVRGAMLQAGQRCTATSRVYVERPVAAAFEALLRERISALVVGDPFAETTDVGPLGFAERQAAVGEYLDLARTEGAQAFAPHDLAGLAGATGAADHERAAVHTGAAHRADAPDSCFIAPTLLTGVSAGSRLLAEEIFGPVLVMDIVDGFEEALARANETEFGLSSSVFTRDLGVAMRFIRATESGVVHVNRETAGVEPHVPFGGIKASSSMSREQGKAARAFFTTTKTAYIRTPG